MLKYLEDPLPKRMWLAIAPSAKEARPNGSFLIVNFYFLIYQTTCELQFGDRWSSAQTVMVIEHTENAVADLHVVWKWGSQNPKCATLDWRLHSPSDAPETLSVAMGVFSSPLSQEKHIIQKILNESIKPNNYIW